MYPELSENWKDFFLSNFFFLMFGKSAFACLMIKVTAISSSLISVCRGKRKETGQMSDAVTPVMAKQHPMI